MNDNSTPMGSGLVIDLQSFRSRKSEEETLARGRSPLYKSYSQENRQTSSAQGSELSDFSERITRIRASLEKINALMTDLKKLSANESN